MRGSHSLQVSGRRSVCFEEIGTNNLSLTEELFTGMLSDTPSWFEGNVADEECAMSDNLAIASLIRLP